MNIVEENNKRILYASDGKVIVIKASLVPEEVDGEKYFNVQYFSKAILPSFLSIEKCEEMYVEMTIEEINNLKKD